MGAARRGEGGRTTTRAASAAPAPPLSLPACPDQPRAPALSSRVQSLTPPFPSGQNPAVQGGRCRTCPPAPVTSEETSPPFPPSSPPCSGPRGRLRPFPSPGVPFPERGLEQRRDVRPLDVQIRRSAFRHLLPLAAAEAAAATAAARPRALWEWRPAAPPRLQVETKRDVRWGGAPWPRGGGSAPPRSAALPRSPLVLPRSGASSLLAPPEVRSSRRGRGPLYLARRHCPVRP